MSSLITQSETEKLDRKSLKRPDQFTSTVSGLFTELSRHQRAFLALVVLLLVLGIVGTVFSQFQAKKNEEARNALFEAEAMVQKELKATNLTEFAPLDVDAKMPESVKLLTALSLKAADKQTTYEARMQLGGLYLRHGQGAQATSWFEKAAEGAPGNFAKALAFSSLGYAFESAQDYSKAMGAFQRAIDMGEASLKPELLISIARNQSLAKDVAKAKETYDQVISQFPGTDAAKQAETLKAKL